MINREIRTFCAFLWMTGLISCYPYFVGFILWFLVTAGDSGCLCVILGNRGDYASPHPAGGRAALRALPPVLHTRTYITHEDRPRPQSPQAPFAVKGRKWAREKRKKGKRKKKTEEKGRAEPRSEEGEIRRRNQWFVRLRVDCGTLWDGPRGQTDGQKQQRQKPSKDI